MTKARTESKRPRGTAFLDTKPAEVPIEELRTWVLDALSQRAKRSVRYDHDLGKQLVQRIERIRSDRQYGEKAVRTLRKRLGHCESTVWALMDFATCYTDEEVAELLTRPTIEGVPFPWTFKHVRYLCTVRDKNRRTDLEHQAAEGQWTTRVLEAEVRGQRPTIHRKRSGPKPQAPRTFRGCLSDMLERTRLWDEACERFWFPQEGKNISTLILERKDALEPSDADMIVTIHERALQMAQRAAQVAEQFGEIRRMIRPGDKWDATSGARPTSGWTGGQPRRTKRERRRGHTAV
jgi:hypothetical protein